MTHSKEEEIQGTIENLLRNNQFKSYSKEEIINLISRWNGGVEFYEGHTILSLFVM